MKDSNFLEEKFIELNEIKSKMITYPENYQEGLQESFEKVCLQIESYLSDDNSKLMSRMRSFVNIKRENLTLYNGEEGMPAYIAVNGIVYDISDSDEWKNGRFLGVKAGIDLSKDLSNESGEVLKVLSRFKVVGVIKEEALEYEVKDKEKDKNKKKRKRDKKR